MEGQYKKFDEAADEKAKKNIRKGGFVIGVICVIIAIIIFVVGASNKALDTANMTYDESDPVQKEKHTKLVNYSVSMVVLLVLGFSLMYISTPPKKVRKN